MSASIGACGDAMKQFDRANVEIVSAQQLPSGSTEIQFQPILESMYYCPGANLRPDAGREKVSLVRCGIKERCTVDVVAEKADQGKYRIVIPSTPASIDMVFNDGEDRLAK